MPFQVLIHCRIQDENGCVQISDELNVVTLGIQNQQLGLEDFRVYPNPNNGCFTIEVISTKDMDATLEIVNTVGQVTSSKILKNLLGKKVLQIDVR
ncbi:MAG: hypothetical protein M9887_04415 [Chitinophagales bacterium]|nr:hypothetical protein [Chitinophagales bacterium]